MARKHRAASYWAHTVFLSVSKDLPMRSRIVLAAAVLGGLVSCLVVTGSRRRRLEQQDPPRTNDGDPVTVASEDSFPASDPPAATVTTGSTA
jgi:hypothetical protein